jgi:hypothetical protein
MQSDCVDPGRPRPGCGLPPPDRFGHPGIAPQASGPVDSRRRSSASVLVLAVLHRSMLLSQLAFCSDPRRAVRLLALRISGPDSLQFAKCTFNVEREV